MDNRRTKTKYTNGKNKDILESLMSKEIDRILNCHRIIT